MLISCIRIHVEGLFAEQQDISASYGDTAYLIYNIAILATSYLQHLTVNWC